MSEERTRVGRAARTAVRASRARFLTKTAWVARFVVLLAVAGCGHHAPGDEKVEPVVPVQVVRVESRHFEDAIEGSGQWRSQSDLVVAAPFAGVVDAIGVHVGDRVAARQVVGAMITLESHAALRGAELLALQARSPAAHREAERALALARRDRVRVSVIAAESGIVVRRSVEPGTQVAEAAELVAIAPVSAIGFEAHIPPEVSSRVRPGQRATVVEQGRPARGATVQRVLPAADPADQTTLVWLTPQPPLPLPQLEHFGKASIIVGTPHDAPAVPDSAVVEDDLTGTKQIAVVDSTAHAHWVRVSLGAGSAGWHELRAPLLPIGVTVVSEGQHGLPDSTKVSWTR